MNFTWLTDEVPANDSWKQDDMTCFVFQHPRMGHWNGYVITSKYIPHDNIHEIDVHGGITLNQAANDEFLYGFDTAHSDDFLVSKEYVIEETKRFAENIKNYIQRGKLILHFDNKDEMDWFIGQLTDGIMENMIDINPVDGDDWTESMVKRIE